MIEKPLVSVVMPVYNTEKYLADSIDSILEQTYTNIELICINDGSTDSSEIILRQKEQEDSRIVVYSTQNKGVSAARNFGMAKAKGDYLHFMDSDDMLIPSAIETMVNNLEETDVPVCFCESTVRYESSLEEQYTMNYTYKRLENRIYRTEELLRTEPLFVQPNLMLLKRLFVDTHQLQFLEGVYHEDELFNALIINHADRISVIKQSLHLRRVRLKSIMTDSTLLAKRIISYRQVAFHIHQLQFKTRNSIKKSYFSKKAMANYMSYLRLTDYRFASLRHILQDPLLLREKMILCLRYVKKRFK